MTSCLPHPVPFPGSVRYVCAFHPGGPWADWEWENLDQTPCPTARGSIADQPAPEPNDQIAVWDLVIQDMADRDATGRVRCGTPLQPFNGRDALVDAYQEALDMVVYLRQAIYERSQGWRVEVTAINEPDRTFLTVPDGKVEREVADERGDLDARSGGQADLGVETGAQDLGVATVPATADTGGPATARRGRPKGSRNRRPAQ